MSKRLKAGRGLRTFLGAVAVLAVLGQVRLVIADNAAAQAVPCEDLILDFAGLPKGTHLGEQYASSGIHISGNANEAGRPDQLIVFDSNASGTRDPFMEVDIGNLAIIPEHLNDPNGDGLVDDPNNTQEGGVQIYQFDHPRIVRSFVIVEIDHGVQASQQAFAFDAAGNLIKQVPILIAGPGSVQTVQVDASGVSRLEIRYRDSAGVTDIDLGCAPEQPPQTANLVVIKNVVSDNGGTASPGDFTMSVDDLGTDPQGFPGQVSPGTTVAIDLGAYAVTETGPPGYVASLSADCTGTIAAGETRTCTITNDDVPVGPGPGPGPEVPPGTITIIKNAVPDAAQDFSFTGNLGTFSLDDDPASQTPTNTATFTVPSVNTYTVAETPVPGWSTSLSCVADSSASQITITGPSATILLGQAGAVTCTFTNSNLVGAVAVDKTASPGVIHSGDKVTYTYKVTNTGNDVLHAVTVTDNRCSPVTGPTGDNGNGVLDLQETWTYTCTTTLSADTTNVGSVIALDSANDSVGPVTDTAFVDVVAPGLSILKTSDIDSGSPGDTVTFSFKVTNTGDTTINNISVDDDVLGHIGDISSLSPGQSVTLTATATLGDTNLVNVGSAVGGDVVGVQVRAEDQHQVDVVLAEELGQTGSEAGDQVEAGVLARTGISVLRMVLLAMFLVAMGLALAGEGRRRARAHRA